MPVTREQAFDALSRWQPAPVFLDAYKTKHLSENLDIFFGPPEEFFLAPETQALYTRERLIPILDDGNFDRVLFDDPDSDSLVELPIEQPNDSTQLVNWQQYLAGLMLRIGESLDDDVRVKRIAEIVRFRYTAELFQLWERVGDLPYTEYQDGCRAFMVGLGP